MPPLQLNMFLQSSHVCDQKTNVLLCPIEMVNFMLLACTKLQQAIIMTFKHNHEQKYTLWINYYQTQIKKALSIE